MNGSSSGSRASIEHMPVKTERSILKRGRTEERRSHFTETAAHPMTQLVCISPGTWTLLEYVTWMFKSSQKRGAEKWQEATDPATGRNYYYNPATRTTTWKRPLKMVT